LLPASLCLGENEAFPLPGSAALISTGMEDKTAMTAPEISDGLF
jgi:hypothetical protein